MNKQIPKGISLVFDGLWRKSNHYDIVLLVGILRDLGFDVKDHEEALDYMGVKIPDKKECIEELFRYKKPKDRARELVEDSLEFDRFSKGRARRSLRFIFERVCDIRPD